VVHRLRNIRARPPLRALKSVIADADARGGLAAGLVERIVNPRTLAMRDYVIDQCCAGRMLMPGFIEAHLLCNGWATCLPSMPTPNRPRSADPNA
jgi:hypothetical protein